MSTAILCVGKMKEKPMDEVQIMTYSGDAAVSAQSFSGGPLAL